MADQADGAQRSCTLVIGGSRGIGRATVLELAARGHDIAIGFTRQDAQAKALLDELPPGSRGVLVQGDIATGAERMVAETVAELGGLDGLVVTAVPIITGALSGASRDDATRSFDVVVNGFRDAVVAAQPYLARRRGSVVAVSSLGSQRYAGYYGALSLAKAALETAVRYLAVELGPSGVRVNAVCPCLIDNPQHFDDAPHVRRFLEKTARRTPLEHRLATPQEIARSIAALIGPDLARVTGQVIVVDGGYSLLG